MYTFHATQVTSMIVRIQGLDWFSTSQATYNFNEILCQKQRYRIVQRLITEPFYYHRKRQWSNNIGWSLAWSEPDNICAKRFGSYLGANELRNLAWGFNTICIYQRPKCEWAERFS
ncbi:hypothetical protein YC2023_020529 [Brassica napus]